MPVAIPLSTFTFNLTTMKDLRNRYSALKFQAMELMKKGKINPYLAKLQEVNDAKLQMIQIAANH
jgi:hypothetical protein